MSRGLILPAHAAGKTEIEQRAAQARQVLTLGFIIVVPGIENPIQVQLRNPCTIEVLTGAVVNAAFQELGKVEGEKIADRVLASVNGHMN